MDIEPQLRANLILLARAYADAKELSLSSVGRYAHGAGPFFSDLAKGKPIGFTARKYDSVVAYLRANWPEGVAWPADFVDPFGGEPETVARRRRRG